MHPLDELAKLHQVIELLSSQLHARHAARLHCKRGCSACCIDDLTVFDVEAERIRRAYPELLATGEPGPRGGCAFLDDQGACRIYAHRPYVCRTQGLPLRWFELVDGQPAELRDICPLNAEGDPIESLAPDACWTIGAIEARLDALQARHGEPGQRVALRDLFARSSP
jgi:hypothetical protein